jgi:diguanylate cyclase (GGDEF)-like protein
MKKVSKLPRILSPIETWGFGLSGHIVWIISAPLVFFDLGLASMYVWLPLVFTAIVGCLQVRKLVDIYPELARGVPSYIYRLFPNHKLFSTYSALGFYIGWVMAFTLYGIIIVQSIQSVFTTFNIDSIYLLLVLLFSIIGFVVGFSSPRALSILHLIFVAPAIFLLLLFSLFGLAWLAFSPLSPGFFPSSWPQINLSDWILATFYAAYNIITMETVAVFTADSKNPSKTKNFLLQSAFLIPPIFLGGSYVLARIASVENNGTAFEIINSAAVQIFGDYGSFLTFTMVLLCCLLSSASGVAIAPRVLYQLSKDKLLNPIFGFNNNHGVIVYSLLLCLVFTIVTVFLGDIKTIFYSAGLPYLFSYMVLNFGLWKNRQGLSKNIYPWTSLVVGVFYLVLITVGSYLAGSMFMIVGVLLPFIPILISKIIDRFPNLEIKIPNFSTKFSKRPLVFNQIITSVLVVVTTVLVMIEMLRLTTDLSSSYLVFLGILVGLILSYCSVALVSWTTIPKIQLIEETQNALKAANRKMELDLIKRRTLERKLQKNLRKDDLTQMGNRLALDEKITSFLLRKAQHNNKYALMFLDLDRFKLINDSLGHVTGDKLLIQVAQRLKVVVGKNGFVTRLGGDEFVIFFRRVSTATDMVVLADKLVKTCREPYVIEGKELSTTTSIGVVFGGERYLSYTELIRDADVAMYKSKQAGRNRYTIFTEYMYEQTLQIHMMEGKLRKALLKDDFFMDYQPIVEIEHGRVIGFEALLRMKDGENTIYPDKFLEIAEDTGLITSITWLVINKVCKQIAQWKLHHNQKFYVSINLPDNVILLPNLKHKVEEALELHGISSDWLKFEILESAIMNSMNSAKKNLHLLSRMGCELVIDDFGTGYSNLSRLYELPISTLKIDRTFVVNIDEKGLEIIQNIKNLADELGLQTIVEGVETETDLNKLKNINIQYLQGFLYSKPLKSTDVPAYFEKYGNHTMSESTLVI